MPGIILQAPAPTAKSAMADSTRSEMAHDGTIPSGLVQSAVQKLEQQMGETMQGIEFQHAPAVQQPTPESSTEVSPTESGTVTPRVTIGPCPERLTPTIPPKNFGTVEIGQIYRSGFPEGKNVEFLADMNLNTILTLVETEAEPDIHIFTALHDIKHVTVPIVANKEGEIRSTRDSLCEAVLIAMNPSHHPLHIHCNRGKHRTGCIVACIRKVQRWPIEEVLAEYDTYANPKARPEDIALIKSFEPSTVFDYAKEKGILADWPREAGDKEPEDIWELASALPPHMVVTPSTISESGSTDDGLMMTRAAIDPALVTYKLETQMALPEADKITQAEETTNGTTAEVNFSEFVDEDVNMD